MKIINIFIASNSVFIPDREDLNDEEKKDANLLKEILEKVQKKYTGRNTIKISPWWEHTGFYLSGTIKETIQKISKESDIGVFVFENDNKDKRKSQTVINKDTNTTKEVSYGPTPNSNVYVEYGAFLGLNKKCYIIRRDRETSLPSDYNNDNAPVLEEDTRIIEGILNTIKEYEEQIESADSYKENNQYENAQMFFGNVTSDLYIKQYSVEGAKNYKNLESKALFIGSKSAYLWEKIESANDYVEKGVVSNFVGTNSNWEKNRNRSINCFTDINIDNIVSLGPGVGTIDQVLITPFEQKFYYIPVDINPLLAIKSMHAVHKNVAFAVVDDFEEHAFFDRFNRLLKTTKEQIGENNLFSMLGVTFSNLSMNEGLFCNNLKQLMDNNDYFLLDVIIADAEGKKKYRGDEEIKNDTMYLTTQKYKDFMDNTIKRKGLKKGRILCTIESDDIRSSIGGTKIVKVKYCKGEEEKDGNILLIIKHYKYVEIKNYLKRYFEIVVSAKYIKEHRGIFLLRKKQQ